MNPAATIEISEAEAMLLETADRLFYRHGIGAVSMADIRDTSGLSMRRVYSIAGSKSDLVSMWLRHRHEAWLASFSAAVDTQLSAGAEPIAAVFDALGEWMIETEFRGCGFINTHAESHDLTDEHRQIIRDHKTALASYLDTVVSAAGAALTVLLDGAIVHASIYRSIKPIQLARDFALLLDPKHLNPARSHNLGDTR
jgi:AcrR family transcriptional regulator